MSIFKKFFEKKKLDSKFKKAGEGHKMAASRSAAGSSTSSRAPHPPVPAAAVRSSPSDGARMAGIAALQRVENQSAPSMANRSHNVIRAEALRELREAEAAPSSQQSPRPPPSATTTNNADCVFFTCPLIGSYVLPKEEMNAKIREFLYEQLDEEPGLISCLIIRTCNKDKEKIQTCVETLAKCLNNVLEHPDEEKYRKLRVNNKAFQEKVVAFEGSLEFLCSAGFKSQTLPVATEDEEKKEEEFYVLSSEALDRDHLEALRDALLTAEPIRPELDRNVKVLAPIQQLAKLDLPADFYRLSVDELKREQQYRTELVEKNMMLRTKAMREREAARERRLYRFCFIRTRFPDGLMLQGTFKTWEKLSDVKDFVGQHLADASTPFTLSTVNGVQLTDDDLTLAELGLIPAVVINFSSAPPSAVGSNAYLKPDTLSLCGQL